MLWVEPSAACNLDCEGCPTAAGRGGGVMGYRDFARIIDRTPWLKLVNLWYRGEPLAAAELPEMVAEATRRSVRSQTHSNGILLGRGDLAQRLVEAGLTRITIGIDGPDEETYRNVRQGGTLAEVEAGVRTLVEARQKRRSRQPRIIAECLLSRQTSGQLRRVRETALAWGCDVVRFKTYRVPDIDDLEHAVSLLPDDPGLWRYQRRDGRLVMKRSRQSCRRLAYSALVAWNGDVYPCCFDVTGEYTMGNLLREPLPDIWRGERFTEFRRRVRNSRNGIPMCRNCTEGLPRLYIPHKTVLR